MNYHVIHRDFPSNNINRQVMWWQQDGEPAHKSNVALEYVRGEFLGKVMSKQGDRPWPPFSPDRAVCEFSVGVSEA